MKGPEKEPPLTGFPLDQLDKFLGLPYSVSIINLIGTILPFVKFFKTPSQTPFFKGRGLMEK
jgi:hypothetical protein